MATDLHIAILSRLHQASVSGELAVADALRDLLRQFDADGEPRTAAVHTKGLDEHPQQGEFDAFATSMIEGIKSLTTMLVDLVDARAPAALVDRVAALEAQVASLKDHRP